MDKIKTLLLFLVIYTGIFGQKTEYIDSVFITHTYKSKLIFSNYLEPTKDLLDSHYIRVVTDESMNSFISDSLTSRFIRPTHIKEERLSDNVLDIVDDFGVDSSSNILFVKVYRDSCELCVNSIIDIIIDDSEIKELINKKRNKSIYVSYYQVFGELRWEFITVTIKRKFGLSYSYTLYSEK